MLSIATEKVDSSSFRPNNQNWETFSHFMEIGRGGGMQDKTLLAEDVPRVIFHSESLHFPERTLCNSFKTIMTQTREDDALSTVFGLVTSDVDCFWWRKLARPHFI